MRWALPPWVAALYLGVSVLCFVSYASELTMPQRQVVTKKQTLL